MAPFCFDKLTVKAQEAVQSAQALADREDHQQLEPEHLLLALVEQADGVVTALLAKLGARVEAIRGEVQAEIRGCPRSAARAASRWPPGPEGRLRRRLGRDGAAQGRVLLDRAPPRRGARPGRQGPVRPHPPGRRHQGRALPGVGRLAGPSASPTRIPRRSTRRSSATVATSPSSPARASLTRSSGATRRSAGSSRCCPVGRRTTRFIGQLGVCRYGHRRGAGPSGSSPATSPRA